VLNEFFKNLKKANAEFGYRTATEIGRFISLASDSMETDEAIDAAIVQKLLPKLHGSRKKIVSVTKELWKLCGCEDLDTLENPDPTIAKYKLTADKVLRMYNSALENGFTSFAEA
jgi:5-methylcytosine-specific restriction protein B